MSSRGELTPRRGSDAGSAAPPPPPPPVEEEVTTAADVEDRQKIRAARLHTRISALEQRVGDIEVRGADEPEEEEGEEEEKFTELAFPEHVTPQVRMCNWAQWKNRYSEEETTYAIEALIANQGSRLEALRESYRRATNEDHRDLILTYMDETLAKRESSNLSNSNWMHSVRIQSQVVLQALSKVSGINKAWDSKPHVFVRPFRHFITNQDKMKEELKKVESMSRPKSASRMTSSASINTDTDASGEEATDDSGSDEENYNADGESEGEAKDNTDYRNGGSGSGSDDEEHSSTEGREEVDRIPGLPEEETEGAAPSWRDLYKKPESLEEMRCYIEFVDKHIVPLAHQFDLPPVTIKEKEDKDADNTNTTSNTNSSNSSKGKTDKNAECGEAAGDAGDKPPSAEKRAEKAASEKKGEKTSEKKADKKGDLSGKTLGPESKIRYEDLWYLFRQNELLYYPPPSTDSSGNKEVLTKEEKDLQSRHKIWRIFKFLPSRVDVSMPWEDWGVSDGDESSYVKPSTQIWCYYVDHDGTDWGAMTTILRIYEYEDEKKIKDLEIYPLRFAPNPEESLREATEIGKRVVDAYTQKHVLYNGWTLNRDPLTNLYDTTTGGTMTNPEHIDSDIIVDVKEAFNVVPSWSPGFETYNEYSIQVSTTVDKFTINDWSDPQRTSLVSRAREIVVDDDDTDSFEYNVHIKKDLFIRQGTRENQTSRSPAFADEDYALLPPRLFAYALRERKFVPVDVRHIEPVVEQLDAFRYLQIDESHRRMITSLTNSHFRKKDIEKQTGRIVTQDMIRGKGRGVVILLHGSPGIGKTATAEAVSLAHKKPLFPITCGDLGFTPQSVESSLSEIFRLAHLWDCVLLLDEADVFLSQRTKEDLQRNALVSVFLRILEYYNGILFLTTNRPGILDEAVKSRVHVSLYYKPLGIRETESIFRLNIDRLEETEKILSDASNDQPLYIFKDEIISFASEHFWKHQHGMGRWNGRQIRNAFLIAASLAHNDADEHPGSQKQLKASHFRLVEDATLNFDQFRAQVLGKVDAEIALEREERFDGFQAAPEREREREREQRYGGAPPGPPRGSSYGGGVAAPPTRQEYGRPHAGSQSYASPRPPGSPYSAPHGRQQSQQNLAPGYNPGTPTPHRPGLPPSPSNVPGGPAGSSYSYGQQQQPEHPYGQEGLAPEQPPYNRESSGSRGPRPDGPPSHYDPPPPHGGDHGYPPPGREHAYPPPSRPEFYGHGSGMMEARQAEGY